MNCYLNYTRTAALLLLTVLMVPSCKKFLEEDLKSQVSVGNFYKTEADAIAAVNAVYAYLNSTSTGSTAGVYHSSFWVTAGLASDEMLNNQLGTPDLDQLSSFTNGPQNKTLLEIWQMNYKTITVANIAIERIPLINMDPTLRTRLVNEAKFLRGLMYFNLVRLFGDVPLLTKEVETLKPSRTAAATVYDQVIADLSAAEALPLSYPAGNGKGRATSGAAKAILAKVYLTRKVYDKAAAKALEVINSKQYQLWDDYADVFKLSSRNGKEAIFSVGFGDGGGAISFWEVGQFNVRLLPAALSEEGVENAQGWQIPTLNLYSTYDIDDRRRSVTFVTEIHNKNSTTSQIRPYIQKYWDRVAEPKANGSANDFPVIRYADVLLIYAEASSEQNDPGTAAQYINMVRKRARFNGTVYLNTVPDYGNLSKEAFRTAVLKERRMEFVAEGQRWFDLARTGTLETLVPLAKPGVTPKAKNYLFPIPQQERDINENLTQNLDF
ncbi:RagB/SusD family nutrient uptake outer membrane protein [Pedobacter heparinus]|uniref:RagB/SusD domain protein n=1 Tax=Pedobacter heparinus (strain ATCC 13125 / DSM 2366 / CIP 104194 / JCM 7457 / NBRC 12017 / NCIMB 9290 / NRRL B-14731 / HIM 762-3) TaxID=485917 RepID=C6Y1K1_PEDHD|nr:RagB/SusD family nutrient uptake outer membrane protein [Pedobacter heparinus]ACU02977.1 RagB/SusD domain protein [Pedobacter heparinus DSM 2366]